MARTNHGDTKQSAQQGWNSFARHSFAGHSFAGYSFAGARAVEISLLSHTLKTGVSIISRSLTEDRKSRDAAFRYEYSLMLG